jgi:FKBP-type peptidyl-prolyl cis-trans isomerase
VRTFIALGVVAGLLVSLSACTTSAPSGECTPSVSAGESSALVTASGSFGSSPTASFPTPLNASNLQVSVISKGDGPQLYDGDIAEFYATGFDGATGVLGAPSASYSTPNSVEVSADEDIQKIFECVTVGSRLSVVVPIKEGTSGGTGVYIFDVVNGYYGKAVGSINAPESGFPSVVTAPGGEPGITILATPAPTDLRYTTLVTGTGKAVAANDTVKLQYTAVDWSTKTVVSSSWTDKANNGLPVTRTLTAFDSTTGSGLAAGVLKALIGKTVGSQVIVVLPPKSYASGIDFNASTGSTLVIVYDILDIAK